MASLNDKVLSAANTIKAAAMPLSGVYRKTVAITAAAQHLDMGAGKTMIHVSVSLDAPANTMACVDNTAATAITVDKTSTNYRCLYPGDTYERPLAAPVRYLHFIGSSVTGEITVEAW